MKSWPVQDAKSRFSEVIELARTKGPQTITKHGKPVVVLVEAAAFRKANQSQESPRQFFARFRGLKLEPRRKDLPRKVTL